MKKLGDNTVTLQSKKLPVERKVWEGIPFFFFYFLFFILYFLIDIDGSTSTFYKHMYMIKNANTYIYEPSSRQWEGLNNQDFKNSI